MSQVRRIIPRTMKSIDRWRGWRRWSVELEKVCRELDADVIVACDFDTLKAAARVKADTGCTLIYDAHELWIDQECHLFLTRPFRWWFLRKEHAAIRAADLRTTVGNGLADVIRARHGEPRPLVVYNGPDQVVDPPKTERALPSIYFQGSFTLGRGLEEAVMMMTSLRGRATLTLQGFGPLESSLRSLASSLALDDGTVNFAAPVPPTEVSEAASCHDIGLIAVEPLCLNNVLSMPNKVFTYLGGSLALVTTEEAPEIAAILRERECGVSVSSWSAKELALAVGALVDDPSTIRRMRRKAREACDYFRWERQFEPVVDFLIAGSPK